MISVPRTPLADGGMSMGRAWTFGIRPIAASDGEALREFARSLSFESRYLPFMSAVNELDSDTVERLTKIDHRRDAVLIARVRDSKTDRVVGVARYALEADGRSTS